MSRVLQELPLAIAARDFDRVERCFRPDIRLRALTPSGVRDADSSRVAREIFADWFANANPLRLVESTVDSVHGRPRLRYRMTGFEDGRAFVVEQIAYCDLIDNSVDGIDLVCSGFRTLGDLSGE
jgi:hypothetical protein